MVDKLNDASGEARLVSLAQIGELARRLGKT